MGDMAEVFQAMKEMDRERKQRNLSAAKKRGTDGWTIHTEWHWSRVLDGSRLDYWPSRNCGDVHGFIRRRASPTPTKDQTNEQ